MLVEGGLAAIGVVLGWLAGINALGRPSGAEELVFIGPMLWGMGAGIAGFAVMAALDQLPIPSLRRLRALVEEALGRMLKDASVLQLCALAAAAGIGEEVLFRGFLQQGLADAMKRMEYEPVVCQVTAIGLASLIFGLFHAITKTYVIVAAVIGGLLGYLYLHTDSLIAPIVAHGVYDFVAILFFMRSKRAASTG